MGAYYNGSLISNPFLVNGVNHNAYSNGSIVFSSYFNGVQLDYENTTGAEFLLVAGGDFEVDWGDGNTESISRSSASIIYSASPNYTHTYATSGNYTVKITGAATSYTYDSSSSNITTMNIRTGTNKNKIKSVNANLDSIFPNNSANMRFLQFMSSCTGITTVKLKATGAARVYHCYSMFSGCTGLTSFNGIDISINGTPQSFAFSLMFSSCTNISDAPKASMFSNISGAPASGLFYGTFTSCSKLYGAVPSGFVGSLVGTIATYTFYSIFQGCPLLTNISGGYENCQITAANVGTGIKNAYYGCTGITSGASPVDKNGLHLYDFDTTTNDVDTFLDCTGLSDYATIPTTRK